MVFVIDNLKYDTDKMELISDYVSKGVKLLEEDVKKLLLEYDLQKYEELFGSLRRHKS